ncbi:unnamed protein product, partial [marine sediment metagenome]
KKMTMKKHNEETKNIIAEREFNRRKLERDLINQNIAERDRIRLEKQQWEEDGKAGTYSPEKAAQILADKVEADKLLFIEKEQSRKEKKAEKIEAKRLEDEKLEDEKRVREEETRKAKEAEDAEIKRKAIEEKERLEVIRIEQEKQKALEAAEKAKKARLLKEVEEAKQAAIEAQQTLNKSFENYVDAIDDVPPAWIHAYEEATGKKAIWRGEITQGFKAYIEDNGFLEGG